MLVDNPWILCNTSSLNQGLILREFLLAFCLNFCCDYSELSDFLSILLREIRNCQLNPAIKRKLSCTVQAGFQSTAQTLANRCETHFVDCALAVFGFLNSKSFEQAQYGSGFRNVCSFDRFAVMGLTDFFRDCSSPFFSLTRL